MWQFTTPFPFLGNGVEWNGVVKLEVFYKKSIGINEKIWVIIQRCFIKVDIVPKAAVLGMQA